MIIEVEFQFEKWNILTQQHEMRWDYVHALDEEDARAELAWIHGDLIDVVSCVVIGSAISG
jgi:hypothetical protein